MSTSNGAETSLDGKLELMHILTKLKTRKRTGWVRKGIPGAESIADHMYRMSVLALMSEDDSLNVLHCTAMAVVHDLAEAQVGDITPFDGISREEKQRLETEAMDHFLNNLLANSPKASQRIRALWEEYEHGQTKEAKFVKDLDRFELGLQAVEYEQGLDLQEFFDSTQPKIACPEVENWSEKLLQERKKP